MKPKVLFRADGNAETGLGHLVRSLALACMLRKHFEISFFSRNIPENIRLEMEANGISVVKITEESDFLEKLESGMVVVLDSYHFDVSYHKKIKEKGARLACIDDIHDQQFDADLIINQAPGIHPEDYSTTPGTRFALGPGYALLRPAFLQAAKNRSQGSSEINSVLLCFGGSDHKKLTLPTLKVLLEYPAFTKIMVVTGTAFQGEEELLPLIKSSPITEYYHAIGGEQMCELMQSADLAVVPSSGILVEALACGCRVISGAYVENQKYLYNNFNNAGMITSAEAFDEDKLREAIQKELQNSGLKDNPIDGLSGKRLLDLFLQMILKVRPAGKDDAALLFEWANNTAVRQNALNRNPLVWEDHLKWLDARLSDPNSRIFIMEYNNEPVGQIRYDHNGEAWVIDYSIREEYRGKGFGDSLLKLTLPLLEGEKIRAAVSLDNLPSARVFENNNFSKKTVETLDTRPFSVYELQL